jgi:hypothetical protein
MSQCSRTARNGYSCPADNCAHSASACISYSRPTRSWPCHLVVYSLSAHTAETGTVTEGQLHPFTRRLASHGRRSHGHLPRYLAEGARAPRLRRCLISVSCSGRLATGRNRRLSVMAFSWSYIVSFSSGASPRLRAIPICIYISSRC